MVTLVGVCWQELSLRWRFGLFSVELLLIESPLESAPKSNTRLERTRHEQASLLSNLGEPLKRNVIRNES